MSEKENQKTFVDLLSVCLSSISFVFVTLFFHWGSSLTVGLIFNQNPSLSLAVRFLDCGRSGLVRFECSNPSDFRIEASGVVYAARGLQLSTIPVSPLLIKASDTSTEQQWVTQVRLTAPTDSVKKVNKQYQQHSTFAHLLLLWLLLPFHQLTCAY